MYSGTWQAVSVHSQKKITLSFRWLPVGISGDKELKGVRVAEKISMRTFHALRYCICTASIDWLSQRMSKDRCVDEKMLAFTRRSVRKKRRSQEEAGVTPEGPSRKRVHVLSGSAERGNVYKVHLAKKSESLGKEAALC